MVPPDWMILPPMSDGPAHSIRDVVHCIQIELLRMNRVARPFSVVLKVLVPRLEDDLQKLHVPVRPTHVFGRAATLTGKADRLGVGS